MGWYVALLLYLLGAINVGALILEELPGTKSRNERAAIVFVVALWPICQIAVTTVQMIKAVRS